MRFQFLFVLILTLLFHFPANGKKKEALETGDQAKTEVAKGFYIQPDIGLVTFLIGDGSLIYRPGIKMNIRFGYDVRKDLSVYGIVGASVTGNTNCFRDPNGRDGCQSVKDKFGTQASLSIPRQAFFVDFGVGVKWDFLDITDRFFLFMTAELVGQIIPADVAEPKLFDKLDPKRQSLSFGGGAGLGLGIEYYFIAKHLSFLAEAKFYFYATPFMPSSGGGISGLLGPALFASVGLKYTF